MSREIYSYHHTVAHLRSFVLPSHLTAILACVGLLAYGICWAIGDPTPSAANALPPMAVTFGGSTQARSRRRDDHADAGEGGRPDGSAASYARYSSDMQDASSTDAQQRKCRERAARDGQQIAAALEFKDEAVSGTKLAREGLRAMMEAARAGQFQILYFENLSRLARESVITMPMLKELVYVCRVRIISIDEGLDSVNDSWELLAAILSIQHERFIKDLGKYVFRGQEEALRNGFSLGGLILGYTSSPVEGSEKDRRGRNAKPRKVYAIDEKGAPWVLRVFFWFVRERRPLRWIVRELNRMGAPKGPCARSKNWEYYHVRKLLRNEKYIGWWSWGETKTIRNPLTGQVTKEKRSPGEAEKWRRHFPDLRLIDDETFEKAQQLLDESAEAMAEHRDGKGQFAGSPRGTGRRHPRHLLSGLVRCRQCGRRWIIGGTGGKYFYCPGWPAGTCACKTQLPRDRAKRMVLEEIGRRILSNPAWKKHVLEETMRAWETQEAQLPSELAATEKALAEVDRKIARLVDSIEEGVDDPEVSARLAERRKQKKSLTDKLSRLQQAEDSRLPAPSEEWANDQLHDLSSVLSGDNPAAAHALRDLVGGEIVIEEVERPGYKRRFMRGRFTIRAASLLKCVDDRLDGSGRGDTDEAAGLEVEIVIDFREPASYEIRSEKAKTLYDQGLLMTEIAEQLGCKRSYATKLLRYWFESRGLPFPDGRRRRSRLAERHLTPPIYQTISDDVKLLADQGLLLCTIAEQLGRDTMTNSKALKYWYASRGLPVPDGRTRRKSLARKVSQSRRCPTDEETGERVAK